MGIGALQRLIENSELSEPDKNFWLRFLEVMDDEQAQAILDAVTDDPHELENLTRTVKLKQVAFLNGDDALLDQILEEEKESLANKS